MLAASSFSLIVPALASAKAQGAGSLVGDGVLAGALFLIAIKRLVPHGRFIKGLGGLSALAMKRAWLFVLAISLHNLPEGLAIGMAYDGTDPVAALALATGISIQDVPEGVAVAVAVAVALALRSVGYSHPTSAGRGMLFGLVEPVTAVFGVAVISLSASLLPWGLAAAAGAMLFVIRHEIIPESHRQGHESFATGGLLAGFVS